MTRTARHPRLGVLGAVFGTVLGGVLLVGALAALGLVGGPASAVAEEVAAAASGGRAKPVVLRWQSRQQRDVYGYLVYRSTRREGPYLRVSEDIVHKRGGGRYVWRDRDVEPGVTYYYYLDVVSTAGRKTRFSGVQRKTAELRPPRRRDRKTGAGGQPPGSAAGSGTGSESGSEPEHAPERSSETESGASAAASA